MRAMAEIEELQDTAFEHKVKRNLARIMNLKILEVNLSHHTLSMVYDSGMAFEQAKLELERLGCTIKNCVFTTSSKKNKTNKNQL
jgi:hypothetical protein